MKAILFSLSAALFCAGCSDRTKLEQTRLETVKAEEHTQELRLEADKAEKERDAQRAAEKQKQFEQLTAWRIGISNVLDSRLFYFKVASKRPNGSYGKLNQKRFLNDIKDIDTKDCPPVFRVAWVNYVASCQKQYQKGGKMIAGLIGLATPLHAASATLLLKTMTASDPRTSAWVEVVKISLRAGVDVPADPN